MQEASFSFGRELVDRGSINERQLAAAIDYHRAAAISFAEALTALGFIEKSVLVSIASEYARASKVELTPEHVDLDLIRRLPRALIFDQGIVPVRQGDHTFLVLSRPVEPIVRDEIECVAGVPLEIIRAREEDIQTLLEVIEQVEAKPEDGAGGAGSAESADSIAHAKTADLVMNVPDPDPEALIFALVRLLENKGIISPTELAEAIEEFTVA